MHLSVGVASTEQGDTGSEDLMREADLAMYRAKRGPKAGSASGRQDNRLRSSR